MLDDATTNAADQMDPRHILRGRCPRRRAISSGAGCGGVEPRKFGLGGLVAGLLLVTCAYYFSTVKLDAVRIVVSKQPMNPSEACKDPLKPSSHSLSLSACICLL